MNFRVYLQVCCVISLSVKIAESRMREVFGARCQARCLAKTFGDPQQKCTGPCNIACAKPCIDHENFYKVKSCKDYCRDVILKRHNWQCRTSCKYLLQLYNAGIKSGICKSHNNSCESTNCQVDNECPDLDKCCQYCCQKPTFNMSAGYPSMPMPVNSTFIKRPSRSVVVKWSYTPWSLTPGLLSERNPVIFIVEVRQVTVGSKQGVVMGDWNYLNMTKEHKLSVYPNSKVWLEYRILAVNEKRTSAYSTSSSAIYIPPERPTPPRNFRVKVMTAAKGKVHVELAWSKPDKLDIPIHRYRVFWSRRLDSHTKELMSLREHNKRLHPDQHSCIINGLGFNTTYRFEIQAICHYKGQRLRSKRINITARTIDKEVPDNTKASPKKMKKVLSNSFKKPAIRKKPKPPDQTVSPTTVPSSVEVKRQENGSKMPFTAASGTSRSVHTWLHIYHVIWLLLVTYTCGIM